MTSDEPDGDDGLTPAQRAEVKKLVANETEEAETTRRGALKVGGGLLGLGLLGGSGLAASSGSAQAGDDQVGDAGSQSAPLDFFAEDLYDKNGNRVAELPGDGSLDVLQELSAQVASTGVARTKTQPKANVKAHGAVGDGTTDDTQAIRDARDAVGAGDVVFFPPGDYLVSSSIDRKGRAFVGAGPFSATVVADTSGSWGSGGHSAATAVLYDRDQDNCETRDLGVDVNGEDAAGITHFGGDKFAFTNNYVRNSSDCGIQTWGNDVSSAPRSSDGIISGNLTENNEWNLVLDGAFENCVVECNTSRNAKMRHIGMDAKQTADNLDSRGNVVVGNTCRGFSDSQTADQAIALFQNSSVRAYVNIQDNYLYDWPGIGLMTMGAGNVSGNTLHGNGLDQMTVGIKLDANPAGILVSDNDVIIPTTGIQAVNSPTKPRIYDNVLHTSNDTNHFDVTTASDWVVERNYGLDGADKSPTT